MEVAGRARLVVGAVAMALLVPGSATLASPDALAAAGARRSVTTTVVHRPAPTTGATGTTRATSTTRATAATAVPLSPAPVATPAPHRWPGRTFVAGDSLTATSLSPEDPGPGGPDDLAVSAGIGWTARHVQPHLDLAQLDRPVDTLVVALANNDAASYDGGWGPDDEDNFRRLVGSVPDDACVVLVLPGYSGPDVVRLAETAEARLFLWMLADERRQGDWYGPTVVVDWQERVDARPDLMAADGLHLAPRPGMAFATPEAAAYRTSLYWEGTARCAAPDTAEAG